MDRKFNTAGPCRTDKDYMLPAAERLPMAPGLVKQEGYFVVHAPRQTGKTTAIRALARELVNTGRYAALAFSCEAAAAAGEDIGRVERLILRAMRRQARLDLPADLHPPEWPDVEPGDALGTALEEWALECRLPLVLFFDEIDSIQGSALVFVLRQLRAGYANRPTGFPASVILCGMKNVRDYKAASGGDTSRLASASPFNIKLESLRLGDFSSDEVRTLYAQHTDETGQAFEPDAVDFAYYLTAGQPWLVNALAREVIEKMRVPTSEAITVEHFSRASDQIIKARATHLDSLVARLNEPRVSRMMIPLIAGDTTDSGGEYNDDLAYLRDLGLIATDLPIRVANPIYREVILRVLAAEAEGAVKSDPSGYINADGSLDFAQLLDKFLGWWPEHGEILSSSPYHEVAPQLILMGFMHRIVNGGGFLDREYAIGRGRIDLLIRWPYTDAGGTRQLQREGMEVKVWRSSRPDPLAKGLEQLDAYLDRQKLDTGALVIFDQRTDAAPIAERTGMSTVASPSGRDIRLLRC